VEITSETEDSDENTEPFETNSEEPTNDASGDDVCQGFDEDDEASGSPVDILDIIQLQLKEVSHHLYVQGVHRLDCGNAICEVARSLQVQCKMQSAMPDCQPCHCQMQRQRGVQWILLCTADLGE
jgi:hypothetical protein